MVAAAKCSVFRLERVGNGGERTTRAGHFVFLGELWELGCSHGLRGPSCAHRSNFFPRQQCQEMSCWLLPLGVEGLAGCGELWAEQARPCRRWALPFGCAGPGGSCLSCVSVLIPAVSAMLREITKLFEVSCRRRNTSYELGLREEHPEFLKVTVTGLRREKAMLLWLWCFSWASYGSRFPAVL